MIKTRYFLRQFFVFVLFSVTSLWVVAQSQMEKDFIAPPSDTKPSIYWYWIDENLSKEGITRDLEEMAKVGIGEVYIGNIYDENGLKGAVSTLSQEWYDCMRHAIKEGTRLGVGVSIFNGPGWSQSGGPWVEDSESMRFITYSEKVIDGGNTVSVNLEKPRDRFQDVAVLAFPIYDEQVLEPVAVDVNTNAENIMALFDNNRATKVSFRNKSLEKISIDIRSSEDFTARALSVFPREILPYRNDIWYPGFKTEIEFLVKEGSEYKSVGRQFFDRENNSLQLGFSPDAAMIMALPDVTGTDFRIIFHGVPENFELSGIELCSAPKLQQVAEKTLAKMPNTPSPAFDTYMCKSQLASAFNDFPASKDVINLTANLQGDVLKWDAPIGRWRVVRFGMSPTGVTNVPAAPSGRGLEIDKLSIDAVRKQYDSFIGKVVEPLSPEEKKSLRKIVADSYEVGPQNWTDNFAEEFRKRTGYDPIPYLPVLTGQIIGSVEQSDRFLWDMRKVASDMIAEFYVGGWSKVARENGMTVWLENYGHWGFPSEFLTYASLADDIGGEFWTSWERGAECKMASSAANIYGKQKVYAESYTAGGNGYGWYPYGIKHRGDWSYTEGINQVVIHLAIHQPYLDKVPGITAWFGIEYNHHNTWFEKSKAWIDYQRRCCYMLQQGLPKRDVCFFIGEDAPQMHGWRDPMLSQGYSYDYINADVLINKAAVKDEKIVLPSGLSYDVLALPPLKTMRPELLSRLVELVEQGAVLDGMPPVSSPSLSGYPECDTQVSRLAVHLWGKTDIGQEKVARQVGKGRVYANVPINEVLKNKSVIEDVQFDQNLPLLWTHRTLEDDGEIYFISNQKDTVFSTNFTFRVTGRVPELWDATQGAFRKLPSYNMTEYSTTVPVLLHEKESAFIVFREKTDNIGEDLDLFLNYPSVKETIEWNNPWNIQFTNKWLDEQFEIDIPSLFDWSTSEDKRVKHFSGTAVCKSAIRIPKKEKGKRYILHFDDVRVMATLSVNGKTVADIWTPPYEADITDYIKKGNNHIQIEVCNLWVNKLQEEALLPQDERKTWTSVQVVNADRQLEPSGVFGNPRILVK